MPPAEEAAVEEEEGCSCCLTAAPAKLILVATALEAVIIMLCLKYPARNHTRAAFLTAHSFKPAIAKRHFVRNRGH